MIKTLAVLYTALFLTGCQSGDPLSGEHDSRYPWWSLEFVGPTYMTGWVEASLVEDEQEKSFYHGSGGVIGSGNPGYATEVARGWPKSLAGGPRAVVGAGLPKRIFVRWQSAVEPQTYRGWIDLPDKARRILHDSTRRRCPDTPEQPARYMGAVYLGLAPGGVIQAWVRDQCHRPITVARAQAEVEPLGPHLGKSGGNYYPQPEASKRYVEKYGVPYGSW